MEKNETLKAVEKLYIFILFQFSSMVIQTLMTPFMNYLFDWTVTMNSIMGIALVIILIFAYISLKPLSKKFEDRIIILTLEVRH